MAAHTPGPWVAEAPHLHGSCIACAAGSIAAAWPTTLSGQDLPLEANARLMAAAPELLAALLAVLAIARRPPMDLVATHENDFTADGRSLHAALPIIEAAVAKATQP